MKPALRRGAAVATTPATPARKWSSPDFQRATPTAPVVKATPKHSMHFRVISRTGK